MPEKKTVERARADARAGKAPSTQAGEFVHEEIKHIRQGKHGARSAKQAIAIGLSKARRAGVKLAPPKKGRASEATRRKAERDYERGQRGGPRPSAKRSTARKRALKRESRSAASHQALSQQAKQAARTRRSRSSKRKTTVSEKVSSQIGSRPPVVTRRVSLNRSVGHDDVCPT